MKLIAVRHGETEWNLEAREMGQLDSPLTPRGHRQAQALAARLQNTNFDALYSSDLGRALQTAQKISGITGREIIVESGLRERHMGIFQGYTKDELKTKFPDEYADYQKLGPGFQIPQGESGLQRQERSIRVMTSIAERHPDATIVAVTHGGFLMGFFEHVLGIEPGNGWRYRRQNAAYNCFNFSKGNWSVEVWNDAGHLENLGSLDDLTQSDRA